MPYTRRLLTIALAAVLGTALMACAPQKPMTPEQQLMHSASKSCLKQAREMDNPDLNMAQAPDNEYFAMCMQTQYGYTWEQVREMPF